MTSSTRASVNQVLVGLLLLLVGMLSYRFLIENTSLFGSSTRSRLVDPRGDLAEDEKTTIELFNNASVSVVSIKTEEISRGRFEPQRREIGQGSGVVWDKEGHIVTNYHVVSNAIQPQNTREGLSFGSCKVILNDGSDWDAQIQSFAPVFDIAVLKLVDTPASRLTPIAIGRSSDLQVGQKAFAIGSPFGLSRTFTSGIICGIGRNLSADYTILENMIQTDAAINPGNSGGPLLDSAGRMIGVNTLIYSPATASSGMGQSAGIGFAVPIDSVNIIVPLLIEGGFGTRPGLGVTLVPDGVYSGLEGAMINRVGLGSTAYEAGLQTRDIVVGLNGNRITSTSQLMEGLKEATIGESVNLTIQRSGREATVEVTVQAIMDVDNLDPASREVLQRR